MSEALRRTPLQLRPLPALALSVGLLTLAPHFAAALPTDPTTAPTATPPVNTATPTAPTAPAGLDLTPLKKALAPFDTKRPIQSESDFQMSGSTKGMNFTFREHLKILAKQPNKFRAEVAVLSSDGTPQARYQIISDGVKVWTYQPGIKKYSVVSRAAFTAANDDLPALGVAVGSFYIGDAASMVSGLDVVTKENSAEVLHLLQANGLKVTGKSESIGGADAFVYTMAVVKEGLGYRFALDPDTNALNQVELNGKHAGITIALSEKNLRVSPASRITPATFRFTPPADAKKVKALSVDPM